MNLAPHRTLERSIDEPLPLNGGFAIELHRDDDGPEMAATIAGPCVPGVQMTLIDHFDVDRSESLAQLGLDARTPIRGIRHWNSSTVDE
jgi:hypothetical protein